MTNVLFPVFAHPDLQIVEGKGARVYDEAGRDYLDFSSGIAVNSLGHAHPELVEALTSQAQKLWHVSNLFKVPGQNELADKLCGLSFADRAFFTNSGAEALECAIKTARRYHYAQGNPERYKIITFQGAFHGRTLATVAAGGKAKYLEGFGPALEGMEQVPFGDMDAFKNAIDDSTAAILFEPIQGEGGIREQSKEYFTTICDICKSNGSLIALDEVQTGIGRTGTLFAYEQLDIEPDIMALAKGIGGGFPVGACLATEAVAQFMTPGTHGTTFGGNPLAMAVANKVIDIIARDEFLADVHNVAGHLQQVLAELVDQFPHIVADVRGTGLMRGIVVKPDLAQVVTSLRDEGILVAPANEKVIRLLPPLTISAQEISQFRERVFRAFKALPDPAQTS